MVKRTKLSENYGMYFMWTMELLKWFKTIDLPKLLTPKAYKVTTYNPQKLSGHVEVQEECLDP